MSIEEWKQRCENGIQTGLHSLRVKGNLGTALGLTSTFNDLGKLELYTNRDSAYQAKKYFFKAARAWQLYQWYRKDMYKPKHVDSDPKNPFIGPVISYPQFFLLCDHDDFEMDYYADIEIPKRKLKHAGFCMALAYKYLLKDNMEDAREALGVAYKKGDIWTKDFALVLGGIVYQDISLVEKGLDFRRKEVLRINNGFISEDVLMSARATAWVKLARKFGMEPDVSKGMIHEKILEHENMEFEDIDEVFEAIKLEPIKRYELKNY